MGPIVIHDEVDLQVVRHIRLDAVEERAKLHGAMPTSTFGEDLARLDLQCGKQGRRPVAHVIVRPPLDLARPHRQQELRAIQGLDLALAMRGGSPGHLVPTLFSAALTIASWALRPQSRVLGVLLPA